MEQTAEPITASRPPASGLYISSQPSEALLFNNSRIEMSSSHDILAPGATRSLSTTPAHDDGADEISVQSVEQGEAEPPTAAAHMSLPIDDGEFAAAGPLPQRSSNIGEIVAETPYPELEEQTTLQPPASFRPFFTLVKDSVTGEHHHPTVHYIFADDDPDILTNAALDTLDTSQATGGRDADRIVLVNMGPDGQQVESTTSLSSTWQGVLMLRMSGQGPNSRHWSSHATKTDVHELIKSLDEVQDGLETVIGRIGDDTE